ncbi:MAG: hypothetical protein K0S33_2491 [Bacteroidetes bacterium]|jgi:hypothetical protein|nr:hypothetical protein [Bacteroidota bacterium]
MDTNQPNEQQVNNQFQQQFGGAGIPPGGIKIPNSVGVLVLGICSIFPGCICAGLIGITCSIIALVLSKKAFELYNANPSQYSEASFKNLKAGKICAIIGMCTSAAILIIYIIYVAVLGAAISAMPFGNY